MYERYRNKAYVLKLLGTLKSRNSSQCLFSFIHIVPWHSCHSFLFLQMLYTGFTLIFTHFLPFRRSPSSFPNASLFRTSSYRMSKETQWRRAHPIRLNTQQLTAQFVTVRRSFSSSLYTKHKTSRTTQPNFQQAKRPPSSIAVLLLCAMQQQIMQRRVSLALFLLIRSQQKT
jgi:hypothetical protein